MSFGVIFPLTPILIALVVIIFIAGAGISAGIENAAEVLSNNVNTVFWVCLVVGIIAALIMQFVELEDHTDKGTRTSSVFLFAIPKAIALTGGLFYMTFSVVELFEDWDWILFFFIIAIVLVFLLMAIIYIVAPVFVLTLIGRWTKNNIIGLIISTGLSIWYAWYTCAPGLTGDFSRYF